jgi:Nucleotidyl transferase AbiEii toxin, Type IV TA system
MPQSFEPKTAILPQAQRTIWPQLAAAPLLSFVLYGGTAVALHLGHRQSLDFDFFSDQPLDKRRLGASFGFLGNAQTVQETADTLVVAAGTEQGAVKISFFGNLGIGHVNEPLRTADGVLLVASLDDLLATKLKAIVDRAEAKDYVDIAAMLAAGTSLTRGLGAFAAMFRNDPALPLRALGFFKDGDLPSLPRGQQELLRAARDRVGEIPEVELRPRLQG